MKPNSTDFAQLVSRFLTEYLPFQRGYSRNTVLSYRDTFKLLIQFLTEVKGKKLKNFHLKAFTREFVIEFLEWYRVIRKASRTTINQRLAALKTFANYAQLEVIDLIEPLMEVEGIKAKKAQPREVAFLTAEQIKLLINAPETYTACGFRHRVILTILYDAGCRVQELCDLNVGDINLDNPATIRLHGKGDKYRTVVIADATAKLIKEYLHRHGQNLLKDQPLVVNRYRQRLNRDGVKYVIDKYVNELKEKGAFFPKNVHCHMFRHSKAMHMLQAGINIVYIRDFLGHEDITTTMIYARADNRIKDAAINKLAPKLVNAENLPDWNKDKDLLEFLNSLK